MIGWNCDLYYTKEEQASTISSLIQVDMKRFFVIPGCINRENVDTLYDNDPGGAYKDMVRVFGDDVNTIYNLPSIFNPGVSKTPKLPYENLKYWFPSVPLAFPNAFKNYTDVDGGYFLIHINSLNRIIRCEDNKGVIGSVNENGEITWPDPTIEAPFFSPCIWPYTSTAIQTQGFGIANYSDDTDLSDYRNYIYYLLYYDDSNRSGLTTATDTEFFKGDAAGFKYLFGRNVKPDIFTVPPENPYAPIGPSSPDTPETPGFVPGTFDDSSDAIPDSSLPTLSAANTGFTRIYNPTLAQVQDLARYLWTDETVVQTIWNHIKQYFEDPMQAIIGFNLVPCSVPNAGSKSFALMYIDTGVTMNIAANQFVDVDCGTCKLERYYGSALDQSPYTRISCFLPFIGTVRLNTDEVMERTLQVKYRIDICSGSCVAKVLVDGNCIYQYSGHCAINIPISSADFSSYVSSAIAVSKLAIGAAVAGYAGVGAAATIDPSQQTNRVVSIDRTTTTTERNPSTGRQVTAGTVRTSETRVYPVKQQNTQASFNALSPENVSNTVGQIMSSKPMIEHSGSFSGNTGYLGVRRPFLIIERPNMCLPDQYQHFNGYPSMITMGLSECKGYTRIQQVELTGMTATNPEQAEILGLLKSGVYF